MSAHVPEFQAAVAHQDGTTLIAFGDTETWRGENAIARQLLAAFTQELGQRRVLLDFSRVGHLHSMELGTLVAVHKRLAASGGRLVLTRVRPELYDVFERTKLTRVLEIHQGEG